MLFPVPRPFQTREGDKQNFSSCDDVPTVAEKVWKQTRKRKEAASDKTCHHFTVTHGQSDFSCFFFSPLKLLLCVYLIRRIVRPWRTCCHKEPLETSRNKFKYLIDLLEKFVRARRCFPKVSKGNSRSFLINSRQTAPWFTLQRIRPHTNKHLNGAKLASISFSESITIIIN